jgi:hypothetical protein
MLTVSYAMSAGWQCDRSGHGSGKKDEFFEAYFPGKARNAGILMNQLSAVLDQ